jgi:hypothetical protein
MEQLSQDLSAVSSDFFSGFHEVNSLHLSSFTDHNKDPDRNLISPFPEPALLPQPSVNSQFQAVTSSLDNPSLVFQKRLVPLPSQSGEAPTCLASNSHSLVQTIILQQNTISKLQFEKDQLLMRIMELESIVTERCLPHTPSGDTSGSKDEIVRSPTAVIVKRVTRQGHKEDARSDEANAEATVVTVSGLSNVNCNMPSFGDSHGSFNTHSKKSEIDRPSPRSSASSTSCGLSLEYQKTHDSGVHTTNSRATTFTPEFDSSNFSQSRAQSPYSSSSKTRARDQQSSALNDSSADRCLQDSHVQTPAYLDLVSHVPHDSISFTVPKISYTPLSDDDDSAFFTSCPVSAANFSDDSSESSLS